jgi:pimeloyl-ACP methyl ester carboxylesterase
MNQPHLSPSAPRTRRACAAVAICLAGIVLILAESPLWAQAKKPPAKPAEKTFEDVTLDTKDGVIIQGTYYPGPDKKTTVPLILLHDWNGNRTELHSLAMFLQQSLGHAVIVPDLRGHGTSIRQRGVETPIDREKMNRAALESMLLDVEAAKTFLLQRNNEGKLNIEQLGVLGTGLGATLALNWAVRDWNVRNLPTYKMGQDVKALILVSPLQSFKGVTVNVALKDRNVLGRLSVLTVVGQKDARRYADAKRVHKAFAQSHREGDDLALPFYEADSALQGTDLIYDRDLRVPDWISKFINERLVKRGTELPWTDRTSPLK